MPRSPVIYNLPPGTVPQEPNTPIESAMFNTAMEDIEQAFNTATPIQYGGTGATSAPAARTALGLSIGSSVSAVIEGQIFGLLLFNSVTDAVNDIQVTRGFATNDTASQTMVLATSITKRLDAVWAVGDNQGGRDAGSIADGTWHVFLIRRSDIGSVDVLFSQSATSPVMPTNYDQKRRIGSIRRISGSIAAFQQRGDDFYYLTVSPEITQVNPGTSALDWVLNVPTGIQCKARVLVQLNNTGTGGAFNVFLNPRDASVQTVANGRAHIVGVANQAGRTSQASTEVNIWTNTLGQIRSLSNYSDANCTLIMTTLGWKDMRGKEF